MNWNKTARCLKTRSRQQSYTSFARKVAKKNEIQIFILDKTPTVSGGEHQHRTRSVCQHVVSVVRDRNLAFMNGLADNEVASGTKWQFNAGNESTRLSTDYLLNLE